MRQKVMLNLLEEDGARLDRVIELRGWDLRPGPAARQLLREKLTELLGEEGGAESVTNRVGSIPSSPTAEAKRPLSDRWETED